MQEQRASKAQCGGLWTNAARATRCLGAEREGSMPLADPLDHDVSVARRGAAYAQACITKAGDEIWVLMSWYGCRSAVYRAVCPSPLEREKRKSVLSCSERPESRIRDFKARIGGGCQKLNEESFQRIDYPRQFLAGADIEAHDSRIFGLSHTATQSPAADERLPYVNHRCMTSISPGIPMDNIRLSQ